MKIRTLFIISLLILLASCGDSYVSKGESPVVDKFISYTDDERILYKEGMQEQAAIAGRALDESIKSIEFVHGKPFTGKVRVHICDSAQCFTEYTGFKGILAAVTDKGLFLAPYVFKQPDFSKWLTHELSHLHLFQQISREC